jgi:hypothetical protein
VIAGMVGLVLLIAPVDWLGDVLHAGEEDLTTFLVRRYAASATAGLFAFTVATVRHTEPQRAALLALATWFGFQTATAVAGVVTSDVGGLAWLAVIADPIIATWFLVLATRRRQPT